MECMLQEKGMLKYEACGAGCANCGWNKEVHKSRIRYIRKQGLTEDKDGLRKLIIKK